MFERIDLPILTAAPIHANNCAAMSGGYSHTTSTNRSCSRKISEASSSAAARTPSSKCFKVEINDLPDAVLVEIISRLPSSKFVCRCKCVSKRWCTIISAPYSICRFLSFQFEKQTPILSTLINHKAQEMPAPVMRRGPKPLARLFERLVSFYRLNEDPVVVATCNDLVLCCANGPYQRDYYICNPNTIQWVALPPPPRSRMFAAVGFICYPYYKEHSDPTEQSTGSTFFEVSVNAEYRCKVVRLISDFAEEESSEFRAEIFSFEIGEWKEFIISFPRDFSLGEINSHISVAGKLYWSVFDNFFIGLDPFTIINSHSSTSTSPSSASSSTDDTTSIMHYKGCVIELVGEEDDNKYHLIDWLGVSHRCLRVCEKSYEAILVWELKEDQQDLILVEGGTHKLRMKKMPRYLLHPNFFLDDEFEMLAFDPNDEDDLYLMSDDGSIVRWNVSKGTWLRFSAEGIIDKHFFPLVVLPWWPTPIPELTLNAHE